MWSYIDLPFTPVQFQLFLIALLVLVGLNLLANLRMVDRVTPQEGEELVPAEWCRVSVLIPARNEERNIERCLRSILSQDLPWMEVLVLDDASTDATAWIVERIAQEDGRVRLIRGKPLPPGWMGKTFACHQLAQHAQGDWLLFTDADTVHKPGTIRWAVTAALRHGADLVSVMPRPVTHTIGEELLLPIIPFGVLGCLPLALGERLGISLFTMALGPFMLFRRRAYEQIDGHRGVYDEVAEDVQLARRIRRSGGRVLLLDGARFVAVHFYHGFREAWRGLAKSVFAALEYRLLITALLFALYGALFLWPVWRVALGIQLGVWDTGFWLAAIQMLLNAGLWYTVAIQFRLPRRTAIFYPLTIALLIAILLDSISQVLIRGVAWKGRVYHVQK